MSQSQFGRGARMCARHDSFPTVELKPPAAGPSFEVLDVPPELGAPLAIVPLENAFKDGPILPNECA